MSDELNVQGFPLLCHLLLSLDIAIDRFKLKTNLGAIYTRISMDHGHACMVYDGNIDTYMHARILYAYVRTYA
jgi:hypothetical protein